MKKIIIRIISFFLALTALLVCTGCSLKMQTADELMHPPRAKGIYESIQKAFTKKVGKDVMLKSPSHGEYRSSFILFDIDGDLKEEAFVFYSPKNAPTDIHMAFLKANSFNEQYTVMYDITGAGSDISSVSFSDLNGDGIKEIILGWKVLNDNYILSVYKCSLTADSADFSSMSNISYSAMKTADMDQDGNEEIFIITSDNTDNITKSTARMLKMNENSISVMGETAVNSNVLSYAEITVEEATDKKPLKLYIDANVGEDAMVTDVVYWDSTAKALRAPISNPPAQMRPISYRQSKIKSQDINGDGIIEIPQLVKMDGSAYADKLSTNGGLPRNSLTGKAATVSFLYYTCWSQQDGGELRNVMYSTVNSEDGYAFKFPDQWVNRVTVISNPNERRWTFFEWNSGKSVLGNELFSIVTIPIEKWAENPAPEYKILKQTDTVVYAYKITEFAPAYSVDEPLLNANIVTF